MVLGKGVLGNDVLHEQGSIGLDQVLLGGVGAVHPAQLGVDAALLSGQQDAVPWAPLLLAFPARKAEVEEISKATYHRPAVPNILHNVSNV